MAEGYQETLIKEMTLTGTTNDTGNIQIGLTNKNAVVSVSCQNTSVLFIPWVYNDWAWYVIAINWQSWTPIKNTQFILTIRYI